MNALAKRTPEQMHEDLALEQFARALRLRRQLGRGAVMGTPEYGELNRQRWHRAHSQGEPLKIVQLNAENIKKLQAVEINPNGDIVTIAGRNGQGKTSVLDSIWWALAGTAHIQAEPIRKGQTKARIRLDLGEIIVERKFTEASSTLVVENAEGARFPSPQKMLDALLGELSFDPLAFTRMDAKKQFDELRRVAKVEIDLEQLDGLNRSDYAKRTDVNRDAKAKRAQADGITFPADTPAAAVDESALVAELEQAGKTNAEIEQRKARREAAAANGNPREGPRPRAAGARANLRDRSRRARGGGAEDRRRGGRAAGEARRGAEAAGSRSTPPTSAPGSTPRAPRTRTCRSACARAGRGRGRGARGAVPRAHRAHGRARRGEGRRARRRAMPVEGLGFGDGLVTFNGIPLDQCSSAEQLRISLGIAMAANPKIR
jgi:hypothetical protein